jgi:tryptophan synthase beta chain
MLREKIVGKSDCSIIAVEPKAAPSLTEGEFKYDFGDTAGMTPLLMMYTLGHEFIPKGIHAGGLRYHGMSPLVSAAYNKNLLTAVSYDQPDTFQAGVTFARTEGIVPAPESCHAVRAAIDKALECKATGQEKTIVFCLSGHGLIDLYGYEQYIEGTLPSSSVE